MKKSNKKKMIDVNMSIHPNMEGRISKFQKECIEEQVDKLPPIKEGELDVNTDFFFDLGDKYEVSIFIRNGLAVPVNLEKIPFIVVNKNGEEVGRKIFNLKELGELSPKTVRPWKIYFEKECINIKEDELKDLKIIFDSRLKAAGVVRVPFENLPKGIPNEEKVKYEEFLNSLPLLREGQVTMTAYKVYENEDGGISVEIVIRNGRQNGVDVERVPLSIYDDENRLVASGIFYLEDISINPLRARVYSFSFSKDEILIENPNLQKWSIDFMLNSNVSKGDGNKDE